jgi:hypothetical protein
MVPLPSSAAAPAPSPSGSTARRDRCCQPPKGLHAAPGSPRSCGRPPGNRPGGSAAAKRVSFSHPLVSSPSITASLPQNGPGTVFLHSAEVFACLGLAAPLLSPQQWEPPLQREPPRYPPHQRMPGYRRGGWTSDLLSSQPRPELGGALWRPVLLASACTCEHAGTVHQSVNLYIRVQ